jgi:hypothetical protein
LIDSKIIGSQWIGFDLDGTLANTETEHWPEPGDPIPEIYERVKALIDLGVEVRIVTARATDVAQIPIVKKWLRKHGLGNLMVTNEKDMNMLELWDDRAVQVEPNVGKPLGPNLTDRIISTYAKPESAFDLFKSLEKDADEE